MGGTWQKRASLRLVAAERGSPKKRREIGEGREIITDWGGGAGGGGSRSAGWSYSYDAHSGCYSQHFAEWAIHSSIIRRAGGEGVLSIDCAQINLPVGSGGSCCSPDR
jgi:hypothetical protein